MCSEDKHEVQLLQEACRTGSLLRIRLRRLSKLTLIISKACIVLVACTWEPSCRPEKKKKKQSVPLYHGK